MMLADCFLPASQPLVVFMGNATASLFLANTIILFVMAGAFAAAWRGRCGETYWVAWIAANLVLGCALILFMFQPHLPEFAGFILPTGLLILGFGLRLGAARRFAGRSVSHAMVLGPLCVFLILCAIPDVIAAHGIAFAAVNMLLTVQAGVIALEFWRERENHLPSRRGLVAAYAIMAASFCARTVQGFVVGEGMEVYLPDDLMLKAHLIVALLHSTASGAFVLSIAYERTARDLRRAAMEDDLTGLHNRRAFEEHVRSHLRNMQDAPYAVVIFDIDHFKRINDRYGHAGGDAVLRRCGRLCKQVLRQDDFVARIGGEEFAAFLPRTSAADAYAVVERLQQAVRSAGVVHDGFVLRFTISAGICHSLEAGDDFDTLMKKADTSLYRAKNNGRDQIRQIAA